MKVLHAAASTMYGGVETVLVTFARERARVPELEHVFALSLEFRLSELLREVGSPVAVCGVARFSRPWSVLGPRRALRRFLEQEKPDVALCHMAKGYWLFGPTLRAAGVPTGLYVHSPVEKPGEFDAVIRRMRRPDFLIGVSEHTTRCYAENVLPGTPAAAVYNPTPFDPGRPAPPPAEVAALRAEHGAGPDTTVIVQATRLDAWKGHRDLLRALALLKDVPGWVHWLLGGTQRPVEEEYLAELKALVQELGISDRVRFLGFQTDVPRFLAASDIYCQANTGSEGFSMSFLEAYSAGLPIVTTDIGSAREVVTPETGRLAPVGDHAALAAALGELIRDKPLRAELGAAARVRVRTLADPTRQLELLHQTLQRFAPAGRAR